MVWSGEEIQREEVEVDISASKITLLRLRRKTDVVRACGEKRRRRLGFQPYMGTPQE